MRGYESAEAPSEPVDPAAAIVGHVKTSRERGHQDSRARAAISVLGMTRGLEHAYKTRLY